MISDMGNLKKKSWVDSFKEVWLPRRNRNAGARGGPAEPVVAPESLSALEKDKLVSEVDRRVSAIKANIRADKKRFEREQHMSLAPPSYNSQTNQAYAQSNSLANMGMSHAYIHSLKQAYGSNQALNASKASAVVDDLVERVVGVEIEPTAGAGVYCITIADSGNCCSEFHISDAMLKTIHRKWLMARNRAEEDMGELNNSEEGESDVE